MERSHEMGNSQKDKKWQRGKDEKVNEKTKYQGKKIGEKMQMLMET